MEDNRYDYEPEDGYDYENEDNDSAKKSLRGYRIVIILLVVILGGVSALYFYASHNMQKDYELLEADRDSIQSDLSDVINEYDNLKFQNDTIAAQLEEANKMMEKLKNERRLNYAKIKAYQKEVGTLRAVMKNYLRQIDSLNNLNKKLTKENITIKKEIATERLRADKAEEENVELQNKVKQGSVLKARGVNVVPLNANGKQVSRVKKASSLRVDFTIGANDLAAAGPRRVYVSIITPDGYPLASAPGEKYAASREVDYQNEDIDVSIYCNNEGFTPGVYKVGLYMNGSRIGGTEVDLK